MLRGPLGRSARRHEKEHRALAAVRSEPPQEAGVDHVIEHLGRGLVVIVASRCLHVDSPRAGEASCQLLASGTPPASAMKKAILLLPIYHASAMRRALSVGPDARILMLTGELRPKLMCTVVGDGPNALVLPPSPVQGGSR